MSRVTKKRRRNTFDYDVCLSFAGANRTYVRAVANALTKKGVRVFFDEYAKADMWGKDLYTHLDDIYQNAARYCVLFVSKQFARNVWTNHERESAQARAIRNHSEYILPARFDNTRIPGLRPTVGYISLKRTTPSELAELIIEKIGPRQVTDYFPPDPDLLFALRRARSNKQRKILEGRARDFFTALRRMTKDERAIVAQILLSACPAELPDNVHVDIDLLRRLTGFAETKIVRLLSGIRSLGFYVSIKPSEPDTEHLGAARLVYFEWHDLSTEEDIGGNGTETAQDVAELVSGDYCEDHGLQPFLQLDFGGLSAATVGNLRTNRMRTSGRSTAA